jgi:hypothetical protein
MAEKLVTWERGGYLKGDTTVLIAWDREETEPCERGTVGCSVLHGNTDTECEGW